MSKLDTIRAKLDKKLFNLSVLGSNVAIYAQTDGSHTFGGYAGTGDQYGTAVNVIGVPYSLIAKKLSYKPFGDLKEGQIDIVFKYNTTIKEKDKVTFNGLTHYVVKVKPIPLNDGYAAIICRLTATA